MRRQSASKDRLSARSSWRSPCHAFLREWCMPPTENDLRNMRALARKGKQANKVEAELERVRGETAVLRELLAELRPRHGMDTVAEAAALAVRAQDARTARAEAVAEAEARKLPADEPFVVPARQRQGFDLKDTNGHNNAN